MKIGLDIRSFLGNETGIGIYFFNIVKNLLNLNTSDTYTLFTSSFKNRFNKLLPNTKNFELKDLTIPNTILEHLWYRMNTCSFEYLTKTYPDLVHSPLPAVIPGEHKNIITIHDLCMLDFPHLVEKETIKNFQQKLSISIKKSDGIIAVSEFTKSCIVSNFGKDLKDKIRVIYHGSDFDEIESIQPEMKLPKEFLLFVSTIEPRKNLKVLIEAFELIRKKKKDLYLLVVGKKGWDYSNIRDLISKKDLNNYVVFPDYLNRNKLKFLYKKSKCLIFPSHYEGFGLPVLESAYAGIPCLCSDIPVFHEIFDQYPVYFDKDSASDICNKTLELLENTDLYNSKKDLSFKIKNIYNWQKAAEETHQYYQEILQ